jgi:Na+/citrate or Na+/malate symporter
MSITFNPATIRYGHGCVRGQISGRYSVVKGVDDAIQFWTLPVVAGGVTPGIIYRQCNYHDFFIDFSQAASQMLIGSLTSVQWNVSTQEGYCLLALTEKSH